MKPAYKATLFGFAVAVVIYHVLTTAKAALVKVQCADTIEREFSDYDLAAELDAVAAGMAVALPAQGLAGVSHPALARVRGLPPHLGATHALGAV